MITKVKPPLQLSGEDGNVFVLIGKAQRVARRYNRDVPTLDQLDWDAIQKEALDGDYDHVLQTLMKHFDVS